VYDSRGEREGADALENVHIEVSSPMMHERTREERIRGIPKSKDKQRGGGRREAALTIL
jgi:hypothetical protein